MRDMIDRQAALDIYDDYNVAVENGELEAYRKHRERLLALPSAQICGTWIVSHFGANAKCSECGMYCADAYDHDRCDQYCRCCGAKMDGLKLEGGQ